MGPPDARTARIEGEGATTLGTAAVGGTPAPPVALGDRIGRYVVQGLLGVGGMGEVYRAYDPDLDRSVAIKLLRRRWGLGEGARMLLREAQALARLSHPNVVAVFDVGVVGPHAGGTVADTIAEGGEELVFVAMEFVDGVDLATWLTRPRQLDEILAVFTAAARGLAAAHAVGIVHRDFKPANVLVATHGPVRVADFGLARSFSEPEMTSTGQGVLLHTQLTGTGLVVGTPAYMAPEVHIGKVGDAAADEYALFVALYEALYRERPFTGRDLDELVARKRRGLAQLPAEPMIPGWLARALLRGLAADPRQRHASVAEVVALLERRGGGRRRGGWGFLALAGAVAAAASTTLLRPRTERCDHVDELVAATWSPARADAIAAVIEGLEPASVAWPELRGQLDRYATRWHAGYHAMCVAVPEVGEAPWQQLDPRVRCLRHQWLVFDGVVRQLELADADSASALARAIGELPAPDDCAETSARALLIEPPPELLVEVEDLRARLDDVTAISLSGRYAAAMAALEPLEVDARAVAFEPLRLELLATRGYLHDYLAEHEQAERALTEVVYEGQVIGHDVLATGAMHTLLFVMSVHRGRASEAKQLLRQADAMVRRVHEGTTDPDLLQTYAIVELNVGDLVEAERHFRAALEHADDEVLRANVTANLANVLLRVYRPREAEPLIEQLLAYHREHGGPDGLGTATAHVLLGMAQYQRGHYAEAKRSFRAGLAIRERLLGADHPRTASIVHNLATIAMSEGDLDGAEVQLQRVAASFERAGRPNDPTLAVVQLVRGQIMLARGDTAGAVAALRDAAQRTGEHGQAQGALLELAALERSCGRFDPAIALIERVRARDGGGGAVVANPREFDVLRAQVELGRGAPDAAIELLGATVDALAELDRTEPRDLQLRAWVLGAEAHRQRGDCAAAERWARRGTASFTDAAGEVEGWAALAGAELGAALLCRGDRSGAEREFASAAARMGEPLPEPFALDDAYGWTARRWWLLRTPDLAATWGAMAKAEAPAPRRGAIDRWLGTHHVDCTALQDP